jgi:putative membrane protein
MPDASKPERILVLCVDRDDDLGMKAGIKTPVLGRKENVNAATSLALRDPEEADANAMFEAVRIYDNLTNSKKGKEVYEVATIAGSDLEGVEADRQLVSELTEVLKKFNATDVILVTDGYTDEMVLPLIESRVPVTSVRRIVIQHSKSIEETAALFSRYMKLLVENPRYSRMILGLPGLLLVVLAALSFFDEGLKYAIPTLGVIIGAFLVLRGFRLDKIFHNFIKWVRDYSPPPFTVQIANFAALAGILLLIVGGYLGGTAVANFVAPVTDPAGNATTVIDPFSHIPRIMGEFLNGSTYLIAIGMCIVVSGRGIRWFFEHDPRLWRTIVIISGVATSSVMLVQASELLINPELRYEPLILAIIGGISIILLTGLLVIVLRRKYRDYFKETEEDVENFEEI